MDAPNVRNDDRQETAHFDIEVHGEKKIDVVYTTDPRTVRNTLNNFTSWLQFEENRFVGLDLEYSRDCHRIAMVQLSMKGHVLVYQPFCEKGADRIWWTLMSFCS